MRACMYKLMMKNPLIYAAKILNINSLLST